MPDSNLLTLFSAFQGITFDDSCHRYTFPSGRVAISVTTLINKYAPPFPAQAIAAAVAKKRGVAKEVVLNEWAVTNVVATTRGKLVHNYIENYHRKHYYDINSPEVVAAARAEFVKSINKKAKQDKFTLDVDVDAAMKTVYEHANLLIATHVKDFLAVSVGNLIPIAVEMIMGCEELGLCGSPDIVYYNSRYKCLQVWDWKTNGDVTTENTHNKFINIDGCKIPDTKFNHYSLQLTIYRELLRRLGVEVSDDLYFVHFGINEPTYKIYKCADMGDIVQHLFAKLEKEQK